MREITWNTCDKIPRFSKPLQEVTLRLSPLENIPKSRLNPPKIPAPTGSTNPSRLQGPDRLRGEMAVKQKHYAVRVGREGAKIYDNWKDTERAVRNFPYAQHKSFPSREQAQKYLDDHVPLKLSETQILKRVYDRAMDGDTSDALPPKKKIMLSPSEPPSVGSEPPPSFDDPRFTPGGNFFSPSPAPEPSSVVDNKPRISTRPARPHQHPVDPDFSGLSVDQARVFRTVIAGGSVFFTGSAGTGKSHLLKQMIRHIRNNTMRDVHVTASTGIAASLIKGTTLHSFAGLGLANEKVENLYYKIMKNEYARKRWNAVDVLIIDEVSMIDGDYFDKLNQLAKRVRDTTEPFGGIQLILTGDFFQLPPITRPGRDAKRVPYLFESESWDECVTQTIVLKHVFRQSDQVFVDLLNEIRMGTVSPRTSEIMASLTKPVKYEDDILPTELYPRKHDVTLANQEHLKSLRSPEVLFTAEDVRTSKCQISDSELSRHLDKNTLAPYQSVLKVGAQVMLIKNLRDYKLVNGSVGVVTGFYADGGAEDAAHGEKAGPNRLTNTRPFNNNQSKEKLWPKVRFTTGQTVLLRPSEFEYENSQGEVIGSRLQVPLILAWALSIHKSQGQSLDRVKIDLQRAFEAGQVYVALSRATSLNRIQVLGFTASKVMANKVVVEWAKKSLLN
ncbi:hypothetical protein PtB15_4B81 [Puccinia triticina]|nr:hypothetical protein PtB15_4B81 [Puccinia triticina]